MWNSLQYRIMLVVATLSYQMVFADAPEIVWQKTFGGTGSDVGRWVQQTGDGGYVLSGWTNSSGSGGNDVYLVKVDSTGSLQWSSALGGPSTDLGLSVDQTADGGYIISGRTTSIGPGGYNAYLVKANSAGGFQWHKSFGGSRNDFSEGAQQTNDGGYIVCGFTNSFGAGGYDFYLVKTNASGVQQWQKTFGGGGNEEGRAVEQTSDGGFILVGCTSTYGSGSYDVYLVKTDPSGNLQWARTFGGGGPDVGRAVKQTSDGGYIIAGYTGSFGAGNLDVYLIKTDSSGNLQWQKPFGGSGNDEGAGVCPASDGGYIVTGYTYSASAEDIYIVKTDSQGNLEWDKTVAGAAYDEGFSVIEAGDGGYVVGATTSSFGAGSNDAFLIKLGQSLPDFYVEDVNVVQVVFDPDINNDDKIDLVAFKPTAVLVRVGMEGDEGMDGATSLKVKLVFGGNASEEVRPIGELRQNNIIDFYPYPSDYIYPPGDLTVIAEVDPADPDPDKNITESDEGNNQSIPKTVIIKETNGLNLVYVPIDHPCGVSGGYGPLSGPEYQKVVTDSFEFITTLYPVAEDFCTMNKVEMDQKMCGASPTRYDLLLPLAIDQDLWNVGVAGLREAPNADRCIGVVPTDYFTYHGRDWSGVKRWHPSAVLVRQDAGSKTVAHEVGHSYGLWLPKLECGFFFCEEKDAFPPYGRSALRWHTGTKLIVDAICFMGTGDWIDRTCFEDLFRALRVSQADPDVLLISGTYFKDGTLRPNRWYMLENGICDDIAPGDFSIEILGGDGNLLAAVSFEPSFFLHASPVGVVETEYAPFMFRIEYPEETARIEIKHNGQVLAEVNPNSKLLHDAVDSIPDHGFTKNPDQRRQALHNKIDEIEEKIGNNEIRDAANKLQFDVRDKFEKWLVDGYQPQNPLQLSKSEILELVDNILSRFNVIWPGSVTANQAVEPEADSEVVAADTDEAFEMAFYEWLFAEEAVGSTVVPDSQPTNESGNSAATEEEANEPDEEPQSEDSDPVSNGDDEAIAVEEATLTLVAAAETISELEPESFRNKHSAAELTNAIDVVFVMIDDGLLSEALDVLENDIRERTNGCAEIGEPDGNDWITTYEGQNAVYPLIMDAIEFLESLI